MNEKKQFIIPVAWEVYSTVIVEAETLEEAKKIFDNQIDEIPLSEECEYVDGTYRCTAENIDELELAQGYRPLSDIIIRKDN